MYLCKFDESGKRIATVLKGVHFKKDKEKQQYLDEGYIETSDDDYAYYVGNRGNGANGTGYIRVNGKPVSAPPHVPTKEEKLVQLENEYTVDKAELMKYYTEAMLVGDSEVMAELKNEMTELEAEYEAKRKEIEGAE